MKAKKVLTRSPQVSISLESGNLLINWGKMAGFIRNSLAGPSRSFLRPLSGVMAVRPAALVRANSSTSSPTPSSESSTSTHPDPEASPSSRPFKLDIPDFSSPFSASYRSPGRLVQDPNAWWRTKSELRKNGVVLDQYTTRNIPVLAPSRFLQSFRMLSVMLRDVGLKRKVLRDRYHETGTAKKNRLKSERHRRKFKFMVSSPCTVSSVLSVD